MKSASLQGVAVRGGFGFGRVVFSLKSFEAMPARMNVPQESIKGDKVDGYDAIF